MKEKPETIKIDDQEYIRADAVGKPAQSLNGMPYRIVRTYSAGVFAGYQESRNGQEAVFRNARRLWQWAGAASLSQLAMEGTSKPKDCRFPCAVDKVELLQVIEILDCTEKSRKSIEAVPVWQC